MSYLSLSNIYIYFYNQSRQIQMTTLRIHTEVREINRLYSVRVYKYLFGVIVRVRVVFRKTVGD